METGPSCTARCLGHAFNGPRMGSDDRTLKTRTRRHAPTQANCPGNPSRATRSRRVDYSSSTTRTFSARGPLGPCPISYSTVWPTLIASIDVPCNAEWWKKMSSRSPAMKPKPLSVTNFLMVPCGMSATPSQQNSNLPEPHALAPSPFCRGKASAKTLKGRKRTAVGHRHPGKGHRDPYRSTTPARTLAPKGEAHVAISPPLPGVKGSRLGSERKGLGARLTAEIPKCPRRPAHRGGAGVCFRISRARPGETSCGPAGLLVGAGRYSLQGNDLRQPRPAGTAVPPRPFPAPRRFGPSRVFLTWGTFPTCPQPKGTAETCPTRCAHGERGTTVQKFRFSALPPGPR